MVAARSAWHALANDVELQPEDPPTKEEPAVPVRRIAEPLAKLTMHVVRQQAMPSSERDHQFETLNPQRFTVRWGKLR